MSANDRTWEHTLLAMAQQGLENESLPQPLDGHEGLEAAYAACDAIANQHSPTFYTASRPLPREKRKAIRSLYAFCRITDDLIDRAGGDLAEGLAAWRACAMTWPPPCDDPVAIAWADTRVRYRIPSRYGEQLVHGVAEDLKKKRYASFDELAVYCYGVASTVGLMSMHIVGFQDRRAVAYAVKLGVAMQVTNILRDVKEDWEAGRVYLPQDELAAFGLRDADIAAGCTGSPPNPGRWRDFMRFQVERNKQFYAEAVPGIALLHPSGRLAIGAAAELYRAILGEIENHGYDVFSHRARISTLGKLRRLPGVWWRFRRATFKSQEPATPDVVGTPVSAA